MSDELDQVRRYVDGIEPPDAETLAAVRSRLNRPGVPGGARTRGIHQTARMQTVRWAAALFVVVAVGAALLVPTLGGHRTAHSTSKTHLQDRLARLVVDDVNVTVAAGNYDMTFNDTTTPPTQCAQSSNGSGAGGQGQNTTATTAEPCVNQNQLPPGMSPEYTLSSISGHGTVDTNPYAMMTVGDIGSLGQITLYDDGTKVWEIGGGDYGLSAPGQAGPGASLSGYASSVEGTVGQVQGALDMEGLASGTGYLNLQAREIQAAQPAGTGIVNGVPVTVYKLSESGLLDPDVPGQTPEQIKTIQAADAILKNSGFAGKTTWVSVDSEGYIREQKTEYRLPDGSAVTEDTVLSNFGCAGTVVMPGQSGTSSPPAGCISPDTAGSSATIAPSTGSTQPSIPTTVVPAPTSTTATPPPTTTSLPPQGGYRGIENFCAVAPLTGTIHYDGTSGGLSGVLAVNVGGLPPNDNVFVNWADNDVRAPVIAEFATDAEGRAIQSSVEVGRLGEVRGVAIILTAANVPNPTLGRLAPC
ncbi:MAG TPA: hypothetical protein VMP41_04275 [Acidimicrobiales bacterium]|nr:hypothetical protein [Acidimicrobiales bacterium]